MQTHIRFTYTPELVAQIFVTEGAKRSGTEFFLSPEKLSPIARQAALVALAINVYSESVLITEPEKLTEKQSGCLRPAFELGRVSVGPITVSSEPTEEEAADYAGKVLQAAADVALAVAHRADELKAKQAAEEAERVGAAVNRYLEEPLEVWIEGDEGSLKLRDYKSQSGPLPKHTAALRKLDPRLDARAAEAAAEAERLNEEFKRRSEENVRLEREFLKGHGDANQLARFDSAVLPAEEFDALAKEVLFQPFEGFPTYNPLIDRDIPHHENCFQPANKFRSYEYEGPMTAGQFERSNEIAAVVSAICQSHPEMAIEGELRMHAGYCDNGTCEQGVERMGLRVTIYWAGNEYVREFEL